MLIWVKVAILASRTIGINMTQILSYADRHYVCQVSDRLVSGRYPSGALVELDPKFNKTVLFQAKDALVCCGFTGLAEIGAVPTDDWIASVLSGRALTSQFGTQFSTYGKRHFPTAWLNIGQALSRLRDGCAVVFGNLRSQGKDDKVVQGITISITGFQWKWRWRGGNGSAHHVRPIHCILAYDPVMGGVTYHSYPRYWGWELGRSEVTSVPKRDSGFLNDVRISLDAIAGRTVAPDTVDEILIAKIRNTAKNTRLGVSQDCLAVSLMPSRNPLVRVHYEPLLTPHPTNVRGFCMPDSYSGWIVTPAIIQPPQLLSIPSGATLGAQAGWISIAYEGPRGTGTVMAAGTQRRQRRSRR